MISMSSEPKMRLAEVYRVFQGASAALPDGEDGMGRQSASGHPSRKFHLRVSKSIQAGWSCYFCCDRCVFLQVCWRADLWRRSWREGGRFVPLWSGQQGVVSLISVQNVDAWRPVFKRSTKSYIYALADALFQSDLQCIQGKHVLSCCVPWESNPQPLLF